MRHVFIIAGIALYCAQAVGASLADFYTVYLDASRNNPDIAESRAEFTVAREGVPQARAALLPSLAAEGTLSGTDTVGALPSQNLQRDSSVYKLTLTQPVFRVDRWYHYASAQRKNDQAMLVLSADEQDLILKSAELYVGVLQAQDELTTVEAELNALSTQLDLVQQRHTIGIATQAEVFQAQATVDATSANQISVQRKLLEASDALNIFAHADYAGVRPISNFFPLNTPTPASVDTWVNRAVEGNLRFLASLQGVNAASEAVSEYKSEQLPSVDLVAQYAKGDNDAFGYTNQYSQHTYGNAVEQRTLSLQVSVPIFSGGSSLSRIREGVGRLSISEDQSESLKWQVVTGARNYYRSVATGVAELGVLRRSVISNRGAVKATQMGYDIGTGSLVDVLNAQRQLYSAIRSYSSSRYQYVLDTLKLKQVVGVLSPGDLKDLDMYLTQFNPAHVHDLDVLGF